MRAPRNLIKVGWVANKKKKINMRQKLIELIQTCGDAVVRSKNITLNIFSPDKKSNLQIIAIINGLVLTCVNFALLDEYIVINCFENDKFRTYKILYNEITVH